MTAVRTSPMKYQQCASDSPLPGGIVVAMDGSSESCYAVFAAAKIAAAWDCPVHVVSVLPPFADYRMDPGIDQPKSQIEDLRIQLRTAAIGNMIDAVLPSNDWTQQVVVGKVATTIADAAERRGAQLIVVGQTKHGFADRLLGGETTLQIMRLTSVPVMAVPEYFEMPRTAVVAIDFGATSARAACLALNMLGRQGTLYLVHVEPAFEFPLEATTLNEVINADAIISRFRALTADLHVPPGVIVETVVLNGRPAKETLEFADRVGADLIAVGTRGPGPIDRFLLGSVSTSLVRNSRVAVVAAP
jgi:nucleotide-binding universal stress UspA family protein